MSGKVHYQVSVTTGDFKYAGTISNISIAFIDSNYVSSGPHKLSRFLRNDFTRGSTDEFNVLVEESFGDLKDIELIFKGSNWWYCDRILVQCGVEAKKSVLFPVLRWFKRSTKLKLSPYDCELPQHSRHQQQRSEELEGIRREYQYHESYPGVPVSTKDLPYQESFKDDVGWSMSKKKLSLIAQVFYAKLFGGKKKFEAFDDITQLVDKLPTLDAAPNYEKWREDWFFGERRLNGCNPKVIQLCTKIPGKFPVEAQKVEPFLEGTTLATAIENKKIFLVDLKILDGIQTVEGIVLCSPLALFYHTKSNQLKPVAIQLFQSGDENPVFYPSDDENLWLLVKMWYDNADSSYHQSWYHMGHMHFLMESFNVCTHRNLSPSHPIFKLLAPHFLFLIAINKFTIERLLLPGGWVDKTMSVGRIGCIELIAKRLSEFSISTDADFKEDLKKRGLLDDLLPNYYYRKDGLLVYEAIGKYVEKMVKLFYKSVDDIKNDFELQKWAKDLSSPKRSVDNGEIDGVGFSEVHGKGSFDNYEDLIGVLRMIIFICSCDHAAINFSQYDNYSYPTIYPAVLHGQPPRDKQPRTDQDLLRALPSKAEFLSTMVATKFLSVRETQALGDFEVQYHYHPEAMDVVEEFRKELKEISQNIQKDLPQRSTHYYVLNPAAIPNSISV